MAIQEGSRTGDAGLRHGAIRGTELVAQGVANIAPSAVISNIIGLVFISAAGATWLSVLIGTVVMLLVGYCIIQFSKRRATAGSVYTYTSQSAGPYAAYLAGTAFLIGCWGIAVGASPGAIIRVNQLLLLLFGHDFPGPIGLTVILLIFAALVCLVTIIGIRTAARVAITLESLSIIVILILEVRAVFVGKAIFSFGDQLKLTGASLHSVSFGMVLVILGFVGFASSDALGREARNPFKSVPRAVMWPAIGVGCLYLFSAFVQVSYLGTGLAKDSAPLLSLAKATGMPHWFDTLLTIGILMSFFAVVMACINVMSRVLYVMGKEGTMPDWFARTDERHKTPYRAIIFGGISIVVVDGAFFLAGQDPLDVLLWIQTYGSFGYMIAYIPLAVASVLFIRKIKARNIWIYPASIVVIGVMIYVFYSNVYPSPGFPLVAFTYAFIATILLLFLRLLIIRKRKPEVLDRIGTLELDLVEHSAGVDDAGRMLPQSPRADTSGSDQLQGS